MVSLTLPELERFQIQSHQLNQMYQNPGGLSLPGSNQVRPVVVRT